MDCPEIISLIKDINLSHIKDITISIAAIIGAIVAIKGLNSWHRKLWGESEYELSRRILIRLYKYRDAINGVRDPIMWVYETPTLPNDEASKMNAMQKMFYGRLKAYQKRWNKVNSEKNILCADLIEAEALWEDSLKTPINKIFVLESELFTCVRYNLEILDPDTETVLKERLKDFVQKKRKIMYDNSENKIDEYKQEIINEITEIENFLKPKLKHK